MKNTTQQQKPTRPQTVQNRNRPENKDELDSREGEEQSNKGDDQTHNKKEGKSDRKKVK